MRKFLPSFIFFAVFFFFQTANAQVSVTATIGNPGPVVYPTLGNAFNAINAGTHKGVITISITANTVEASPAQLNASAAPSSYSSITIQPSGGARTISGNIANNPL